jgi:hypothetical protein
VATRFHTPFKVVAINVYVSGKQHFELSKKMQDHRKDVVHLSETHSNPHERFFIPKYHVYRKVRFPGLKGGTAVTVRKGNPHNHVDPYPLVSIEATGVCMQIGKSEVLLAAPGRAWSDADVSNILLTYLLTYLFHGAGYYFKS